MRGRWTGEGADRDVRPTAAHVEERRSLQNGRLCDGTLACRSCDAPIAAHGTVLSLQDELTCPFCGSHATVREWLSLATPGRPARVVVSVSFPFLR
jgi:RNA polymerase subunit RPABC4/transcription elongation factor Spt4